MKKLLLLSATAIVFTAASAQTDVTITKKGETEVNEKAALRKEKKEEKRELRKLRGQEVSYQAKQSFYSYFGDITSVNWSRLDQYDRADFVKSGDEMAAYFDAEGDLIGTTSFKSFADLPDEAQRYINKEYAGYTTQKVIFYDDNEYNDTDMILYGMQFADEDNYFVEMNKGDKKIVLQVNPGGQVFFFTEL